MTNEPGEFRAHPPDRAWIKVYGRISEDDIGQVLQQVLDFSRDLPYLLLEVDISKMTGATPEARRVSAKLFDQMPPIAFALVGGSFSQRTLAKLVLKAVEMLKGKSKQTFSFFKNSDDAVVWLSGQAIAYKQDARFK